MRVSLGSFSTSHTVGSEVERKFKKLKNARSLQEMGFASWEGKDRKIWIQVPGVSLALKKSLLKHLQHQAAKQRLLVCFLPTSQDAVNVNIFINSEVLSVIQSQNVNSFSLNREIIFKCK